MAFAAVETSFMETRSTFFAEQDERDVPRKTLGELADIVTQFARTEGWLDRVRLRVDERWYEKLYEGPDHDVWAIAWMPGQSTGFHDHGESAGAFVVVTGVLEEHRPGDAPVDVLPGSVRAFGADYAHDVRNSSLAPAVSIHAYSPPLREMNEFELEDGELIPREQASERVAALDREWRAEIRKPVKRVDAVGIDHLLGAARARLRRLSPRDAYEAVDKTDAVLVDIRPEAQRANEGSIPGALVVERNVLEWRFDPLSSARLPVATDHDVEVIVFCSEGYTSSLAAAALQDLGLWRATDVVGGFHAWRAAGLPTRQL